MPYGVTPQMMEAYSETIFDLSLNKQVRRGDPVRILDTDTWKTQRDNTGLTDPEIAERIGLAVPQVTFIRCITERRLFRLNQYRKLYRLGGGLRYREDRYVDPEEPFNYSADAALLRRSIRFGAGQVRKYIEAGWWTSDTFADLLNRAAPEQPAYMDKSGTMTYGQLKNRTKDRAYALRVQNVEKGEVIAACLPTINDDFLVTYLAAASIGAVFQPLDPDLPGQDIALLIRHSRARLAIVGDTPKNPSLAEDLKRLESFSVLTEKELTEQPNDRKNISIHPPVAADPILLLSSIAGDGRPKVAPLTQQNLFSNVRLATENLGIASDASISIDQTDTVMLGLFGLHLALQAGTALSLAKESEIAISGSDGDGFTLSLPGGVETEFWGTDEAQVLLRNGQPLAGVETRIVSEEGELLAPGEHGFLEVRGPSVCVGYLDNFVANKSTFTADAWFRTGCKAQLNKDFKIEFSAAAGK